MLSYDEMQYFVAFAKSGTLSDVAERYTISQPTITRAMKKAEVEFGVPLFDRTKNSITLNDNGVLAADEISLLLKQTDEMVRKVRAYGPANRMISIGRPWVEYNTDHFQTRRFNKLFLLWNRKSRKSSLKTPLKIAGVQFMSLPKGGTMKIYLLLVQCGCRGRT